MQKHVNQEYGVLLSFTDVSKVRKIPLPSQSFLDSFYNLDHSKFRSTSFKWCVSLSVSLTSFVFSNEDLIF